MRFSRALLLSTCVVLAACQQGTDPSDTDTNSSEPPAPLGQLEPGDSLWLAEGDLEGVEGHTASGIAKGEWFEGRVYQNTVELNVDPVPEGMYYEAWLVGDNQLISTGRLEQQSGRKHTLLFENKRDLRDMLGVMVTLEPEDDDPEPAETVAEGQLVVVEQ